MLRMLINLWTLNTGGKSKAEANAHSNDGREDGSDEDSSQRLGAFEMQGTADKVQSTVDHDRSEANTPQRFRRVSGTVTPVIDAKGYAL